MTTRVREGIYGCDIVAKIFWFCDLFIFKLKDSAFAATKRNAKL